MTILSPKESKGTHHSGSGVAIGDTLPIEPLHHQYVPATCLNDFAECHIKTTLACERKHGVLDARAVPAIVVSIELGEPEFVGVFHNSFWSSTSHRSADKEKFFDLRMRPISWQLLIRDDCICNPLELRECHCLIELAPRCRGLLIEPEAQRTCSIIGGVQEVIEF